MHSIKPKKTLVEQTYEILLDAICTGELAPGERLTQDEIAARLDVSRQPVNSAISILKANNFVEDAGRRGVVVCGLDPARFQAIFEFRAAIEPCAVRLAGARRPPEAPDEAGAILDLGARAVRRGDVSALLEADVAFHEMILRWSGNPVLETSMLVNWMHVRRAMAEILRTPELAVNSWQDHARIIDCLLSDRTEEAATEMAGHIARAMNRTRTALGEAAPPPAGPA